MMNYIKNYDEKSVHKIWNHVAVIHLHSQLSQGYNPAIFILHTTYLNFKYAIILTYINNLLPVLRNTLLSMMVISRLEDSTLVDVKITSPRI